MSAKPPPKRASQDLFCYFDNDVKVRAPFDARRLIEKLGLDPEGKLTPLGPSPRGEGERVMGPRYREDDEL